MNYNKASKYGSIALIVCAVITLFLAQSAFWINQTIFDQANFTQTATNALLVESSRDAIASSVVDKSLENRPVIKRLVGERATSLISGLLGSDLSNQAVTALTAKAYAYTTAPNRKDIKVELTAIKVPLETIISLAQSRGLAENAPETAQIPDEIVLLKADAFPDLSGVVKLMLWLGPLLWLLTIGFFSFYIYIGRNQYAKRVYIVGGAIIGVGVLGLVLNPFIPPPVMAAVPNIELRPVAENITKAFLAPFNTQMYYMIGITAVLLVAFSLRFQALGLLRSAESKISKQTDSKKVKKPTKR